MPDEFDIAQEEAGEDVKICPDCLEEWDLCTCAIYEYEDDESDEEEED
jgi:hypothetical protein